MLNVIIYIFFQYSKLFKIKVINDTIKISLTLSIIYTSQIILQSFYNIFISYQIDYKLNVKNYDLQNINKK